MEFLKTLWNAIIENGQSARDARIGAVGAQQVRDLYLEGRAEEALDLSKKYIAANAAGIALGVAGPAVVANAPKAIPYLNVMMPGTAEWMSLYNAGNAGKAAALGIAGLEAANEAGALNNFVYNPNLLTGAEAALGASPTIGAGASKIAQGVSKGLNMLSRASKGVRDFRIGMMTARLQTADDIKRLSTRIKKWYNAPERIRRMRELLSAYDDASRQLEQKVLQEINELTYRDYPGVTPQLRLEALDLENKHTTFMLARQDPHLQLSEPSSRKEKHMIDAIRNKLLMESGISPEIDFSKLSIEDFTNFLGTRVFGRNHLDEAMKNLTITKTRDGFIIKEKVPRVTSGVYNPENSVTTSYVVRNLKDLDALPLEGKIEVPGSVSKDRDILHTGDNSISTETIPMLNAEGVVKMDPAYPLLLKLNIEYLQEVFPGFKPFGSSVGVAEASFPHGTHDIDGYMTEGAWKLWVLQNANKYRIEQPSADTYRVWLADPTKYGDSVGIDINVLRSKDGHITGARALEMARLYYPEEYSKAVQDAIRSLSSPEDFLKLTPEQLLEKYNPVEKTIADLFEINPSGGKSKLAGRLFVYMSEADPNMVAQGLRRFGTSHGIREYFPASIEELSDIELNKRILLKIGVPGNINVIARDPKKMQNVLDYWYLNQTMHMRGVSSDSSYNDAMRHWLGGSNIGGAANGAGLNTVTYGDSGYGPVKGFFLVSPNENLMQWSLEDRIDRVRRFAGSPDYEFTPEEIQLIKSFAKDAQVFLRYIDKIDDVKTPSDLLNALPTDDSGARVLQLINDLLGILALTKNITYGTGNYSSMTADVNVPIYFLLLNHGDSSPMGMIPRIRMLQSSGYREGGLKQLFDGVTIDGKIQPLLWRKSYFRSVPTRYEELNTPVTFNNFPRFWVRNRLNPYIKLVLKRKGQYADYKHWEESLDKERAQLQKQIDYFSHRESAKNRRINGKLLGDLEQEVRNKRLNLVETVAMGIPLTAGVGTVGAGVIDVLGPWPEESVEDYKDVPVELVPVHLYKEYLESPIIPEDKKKELKEKAGITSNMKLNGGGTINYLNYFK